jgi:dTDP-4-amino-4,6-dideoxygalactose transaminase
VAVDLEPLLALARAHNLPVVEDCAQAHGTRYGERVTGSFGKAGCFSFYPTKNIGAYGDGGAIVTDDDALAEKLRALRMYGYDEQAVSQIEGTNARGSELQHAILRVKLRHYPDWLARRAKVAARYDAEIQNPRLTKPLRHPERLPTHHQYVVRTEQRESLMGWLKEHEIGFGIHYKVPMHHMPAYARFAPAQGLPVTERACSRILSLPLHESLTEREVEHVIAVLNRFAPH